MKKYILSIVSLFAVTIAQAQINNLQMQFENLPQNLSINAALAPDKSYVSFPLIGSLDVSARTSLSVADVIAKKNGVNYFDYKKVTKNLTGTSDINTVNFNMDLLRGGFYIGKNNFVDINLSLRVHAGTSIPEGILPFIFDNPIDIADGTFNIGAEPNFTGWAEFGVGYSRRINDNFRVGIRAKALFGFASIQSDGFNFTVEKHYNSYLLSGQFNLRGGNFNFAGNNDVLSNLFSNPGFGIDLGGEFVSDNQKIKGMLSVSDFGMIFWNEKNSSSIQSSSNGQSFTFDGFGNVSGLVNGGNVNHLVDSVVNKMMNVIGVDTVKGGFTTLTPVRYHAMAEYSIDDDFQHNVSLAFMGVQPYKKAFDYALTAGYTYRSKNQHWQVAGNYTFRPNIPVAIGIGGAYTSRKFQIYLGIDNILPIFDLAGAKNVGARLAINFRLD